MAVPKKRTTKSTQGQRRSHDALKTVALTKCSHCGQLTKPHNACANCGFYKNQQVVKV